MEDAENFHRKRFFYLERGKDAKKKSGPFKLDEMRARAEQGSVTPSTRIWLAIFPSFREGFKQFSEPSRLS